MPWKECLVMDERVRFVGRLLDGENMSEVCRAFGISRKTGDKIWDRYRQGLMPWPSARGCHLWLRYKLLPMSPGRTR